MRDSRTGVFAYDARVQALIRFGHDGLVERCCASRANRFAWLRVVRVPSRWVGLIDDSEGREVLPGQTGLVGWARADVRGQQGPAPRLRDPDFEPDRHRKEAVKLTEDQLLPGFGRDGLQQQLSCFSGIEMVEETVHARFAKASELLTEVDELSHGGVGIIIRALDRCRCA